MRYREEDRIECDLEYATNQFPDIKFMMEFEEKMATVVELYSLYNLDVKSLNPKIISDKARKFIFGLLRISDNIYHEYWNEVKSVAQCVENYLEKHPELFREHRLITDNWEPSNAN